MQEGCLQYSSRYKYCIVKARSSSTLRTCAIKHTRSAILCRRRQQGSDCTKAVSAVEVVESASMSPSSAVVHKYRVSAVKGTAFASIAGL